MIDPYCNRTPNQIPEYVEAAREDGYPSARYYVLHEEGTYNPETKHFCCTECYIKIGQPSSPTGWKCP